jgi:GTP cyclohydrolase I
MSATAMSLSETKMTLASSLSSDASLVRQALLDRGLETPMIENGLSRDDKYSQILASMTDVVTTLGLDLRDDSLQETPHRIAKMYVDELFEGLDYSNFPKISVIEAIIRLYLSSLDKPFSIIGVSSPRSNKA